MERDGAGQEWKERACLTSDEFPRGHRRAPIVHARYGGEIRVYRRAADRIRGIRSPSLLRSHTGGGGERGIRKNSITIIVRCDIDSISLEDFRLDFIRTIAKGSSEPTRTAFLPSGGAASPAMAALLSLPLLFRPREREREEGGDLSVLFETSSRGRGEVSRSFEETSTRFENAAQRGVLRSGRLGRWVARIRRIAVAVGEATSKKGKERAGRGKKEKHGSGYHDASSRRVRCPRLGRVCARTTL